MQGALCPGEVLRHGGDQLLTESDLSPKLHDGSLHVLKFLSGAFLLLSLFNHFVIELLEVLLHLEPLRLAGSKVRSLAELPEFAFSGIDLGLDVLHLLLLE